ncbi:MAG: hypothetical protein M3O31_11245 [Acidobacteriota bacterium]|nr:hypothetical protein [Acidobacteriota bacterium]
MLKTATQRPIKFFAAYSTQRSLLKSTLILLLVLLQVFPAFAWVFPEHRDIAVLAVQQLDSDRQAQLQALWAEARSGHEARLCAQMGDPAQAPKPACIDFAAWAAISGDHSCSARDMLDTALNAPWVLGVARVGGRLKVQLAAASRQGQRDNAVRDSDLALERTDPQYVTRASSNNAHFLLARTRIDIDPEGYAHNALGPKAEVNALGTYVWYHLRALDRARSISRGVVPAEAHADAVRAALADEAFALHFLEDSFAAGHVAGNWGKTTMRKGTHDFYSQRGLASVTWNGDRFVAQGDAFMLPADAERTGNAVRDSLAQLVDSFAGKVELTEPDDTNLRAADSFNVCREEQFPAGAGTRADITLLKPILMQTPVPGLGSGPGELPRFRSEMGAFFGLSTGFRGGLLTHGFGSGEDGASGISGIELGARVGLGMEGILNDSSDGLVFLEGGVRSDTRANGSAILPGRGAVTARLRLPFWLIPGDVVVAGPVLALVSKPKLQTMLVGAVNGGVIPWQAGIATRAGRLQAVLGREVGISIYRSGQDHPFDLPTPGVPPSNTTLVNLDSLQLEFPVFEYRMFRAFSVNQSSGLMLQPYIGFDIPAAITVVSPTNAPTPHAHMIVTTGVRVVFDWRHYIR